MINSERSREKRWIILGSDGRFVTLGRASDPSADEVAVAEQELRARGLAGWLAVMEGNPYVGPIPNLMEVRPLAEPKTPFAEAATACTHAIAQRRAELGG